MNVHSAVNSAPRVSQPVPFFEISAWKTAHTCSTYHPSSPVACWSPKVPYTMPPTGSVEAARVPESTKEYWWA